VKISPRLSANLSYDVLFENDFEWIRGGKLGGGLFGGTGTTGCKPIVGNGWSARLMWRRNGTLEMYLYHQQRQNRCGDNYMAMTGDALFRVEKGVWYNLKLSVTMNNPPHKSNGRAELFINGVSRAVADGLQWRKVGSAKIDRFGLSTFYGGASKVWAPSTTTHIEYDNFLVQAKGVSPSPAPKATPAPAGDSFCATGIRSGQVCCGGRCGTCGGSGCGKRDGGSAQCCKGSIKKGCASAKETGCVIPSAPAPKATPAPTPVPKGTPASDGNVFCAVGIRKGKACCGGRCGTCGGSGCAQRDGGSAQCCTGSIKELCTKAEQVGCLIPA